MRALLIDNYDSFTFNLYPLIARVSGGEPIVIRNDQIPWNDLREMPFDCVILSPGPGRPDEPSDFGVCTSVLLEAEVPILGVCLGHQGIAHVAGARIVDAPMPMHGRRSEITHDDAGLFDGIPQRFKAVRYHSLMVETPLPPTLEATAWADDGVLMGLRHRSRPMWGVQFHPESIASEYGERLIANFMALVRQRTKGGNWSASAKQVSVVPAPLSTSAPASAYGLRTRKLDFVPDPEETFARIYGGKSPAFWLDSSLAKEGLSRFSFMGDASGPLGEHVAYKAASGTITVTRDGGTGVHEGKLFDYLRARLASFRIPESDLPFDFQGGYVGYLGYELKVDCGASPGLESSCDDAQLVFADRLLVFDAEEKVTYLLALTRNGEAPLADAWLDTTAATLRDIGARVDSPKPAVARSSEPRFELARDRATYMADIDECLNLIRAGETYEVCLTNQIRAQANLDPLTVYRALRRTNPAPYAAFLSMPDLAVVCSSPERFLRVDRMRDAESKPIKGTAPRGTSVDEDERLKEALRTSEKDRSENLMVVDLVRNDLGLVCEIGSVDVPKLMDVESYATVHQLVSTVRGRLRRSMTAVDAVQACFPGGSMTGAPKKRTMEIIDALERAPRGVYSGSIGYFSVSGAADFNIVIRTAVLRGSEVSVGVGGGVVALSDPEAEFAEILLKAKAPLGALVTSSGSSSEAEDSVENTCDRWRKRPVA